MTEPARSPQCWRGHPPPMGAPPLSVWRGCDDSRNGQGGDDERIR